MAARTTRSKVETTPTEFDFGTATVTDVDELPSFTRRHKVNPLEAVFLATLETGKPKQIAVPDVAAAKKGKYLIARAALVNDLGQSTRYDEDSGTLTFIALTERTARTRRYSTADVKKWAAKQGIAPSDGRVPKEVTVAFRTAHGY